MTPCGRALLARVAAVALVAAVAGEAPLRAQEGSEAGWTAGVGARLVPLVTHASPAVAGDDRTELYLSQPLVMLHGASPGGRVSVSGMLNLEGVTLRRGELNAGIWGEGYFDRRHPHTFLHELTATGWIAGDPTSSRALTIAAGRGFAPFGTDDPMSRPMVKFPANHHLSQILERYVAIAAVRAGAVAVEGGLFNGNEPTRPEDVAGVGRVGDSWAARVTVFPARGSELQASFASTASPELPPSARSEHRKWSLSARGERHFVRWGDAYALVEWARTDELFSGSRAHRFGTLLAEGSLRGRGLEGTVRLERTTRPEEERLADPFRSPVPHLDVHLLGATRWNILSTRLALTRPDAGRARALPFVEIARAAARKKFPTQFFDPAEFFGDDRIWNLSVGVRLEAGASHGRMGRYGAAVARSRATTEHHH